MSKNSNLPSGKPIYEASPEELATEEVVAKDREYQDLIDAFGKEGARKHFRLERTANHSSDNARADAASAALAEMDGSLTTEQQNALYRIGDTLPTYEDLRKYGEALGYLDDESAQHLGRSLRCAITKMGEVRDPAKMDSGQQLAYAELRHGVEIAIEKGWSPTQVLEEAITASACRFYDSNDAMFMLRHVVDNIPRLLALLAPKR